MKPRRIVRMVVEALLKALTPPTAAEAEVASRLKLNDGRETYELVHWLELVDACAASRFAELPEHGRHAAVGRLFMSGFAETTPGSAVLSLMRVIGPERAMRRMSRDVKEASDVESVEVEPLPPHGARLRLSHVSRPGFYLGVLEAVLIAADAVYPHVQISAQDGSAVTFDVRWTP
ncbi:MAG: DUF2378 family protein [Archangium sp.]